MVGPLLQSRQNFAALARFNLQTDWHRLCFLLSVSYGSYQIGVSADNTHTVVADAFIVVWTDGTNAHVSSVRIAVDSGTTGVLAAGGTVAANLAIVSGVTTIGSSTFAAGNFEWIT